MGKGTPFVHPTRIPLLLLACLVGREPVGDGQSSAVGPAGEFLSYRSEGAWHSSPVEVRIADDGAGDVEFRGAGRTEFRLTPDELRAAKTLVRASGYFSLPDEDTELAVHSGESTLRIAMGGERRELSYRHRPALGPLSDFLGKIVQQGMILKTLAEEGDPHPALVALSDRLAGPKVLQPHALVGPLKDVAAKSEDDRRWLLAVEGLAWATTPEAWMGFLDGEVDRAAEPRRTALLKGLASHPFAGNLPQGHRRALLPLFLDRLRGAVAGFEALPPERRHAYATMMDLMGQQRYTPAIPTLLALVDVQAKRGNSWAFLPLAMMRGDAIDPLERLLESPRPDVRATAAETLRAVLGIIPDRPIHEEALSDRDKDEILKRLRGTVAPKLEAMAARDADERVRDAARRALDQIKKGWSR